MKIFDSNQTPKFKLACAFALSVFASTVSAQSESHVRELRITQQSPVFATKGKATVTQGDFDAYLQRVPEEKRTPILMDPDRVGSILDDLMMTRALAQDAIDRGALEESYIQNHLTQAIMVYLAEQQIRHNWRQKRLADYAKRAEEIYKTNPERFVTEEGAFSFTYLLLKPEGENERAQELALARAESLIDAQSPDFDFNAIVRNYSEAPDVEENGGVHKRVEVDSLESKIRENLEALEKGGISSPFATDYGIVVVRRDNYYEPGEKFPYEAVEDDLIASAKQQHYQSVRDRYLADLVSKPLKIQDGAVEALYERYDVPDPAELNKMVKELHQRDQSSSSE